MKNPDLISREAAIKPILFNAEMVRAILDGKKSVTRMVVKDSSGRTPLSMNRPNLYTMVSGLNGKSYFGAGFYGDTDVFTVDGQTHIDALYFRSSYSPGDILWVRETYCSWYLPDGRWKYCYKATDQNGNRAPTGPDYDDEWKVIPWSPSTRMPKEAARIFLRVKDVRVERLQDIDDDGVVSEGLEIGDLFDELWDSTIKKADLPRYGWKANPWVWVIEFERCEKPEGW